MTAGSFSAVGLWAGFSDQMGARMVRGLIDEAGRSVIKPKLIPTPALWNPNTVTAAWLGHSTVLVNFYGLTILTDPVLRKRVGANTRLGTIGAKRLVAPALSVAELPPIDLVLLSHAHMDHLDPATLRRLPGRPQVVTARNTGDLLTGTALKHPNELGWGEATRISTVHGELQVEAFEVKHWGARWKVDTHRGYNGYTLSREGKKMIFGGDTAWTHSFGNLRSRGPFDVAIMPIGAYRPWICSHCTPEQAVRMAEDAGAKHFLPVHFKTFAFGREGVSEPMQRLEAAIESERIGWREVGGTFSLG